MSPAQEEARGDILEKPDGDRDGAPLRRGRDGAAADQASLTGSKMMLGFVVRDCAVVLGHTPSAEELASWANHQCDQRGEFCLFGRPINIAEARVILKHLARPVTVRPARLRPRVGANARF